MMDYLLKVSKDFSKDARYVVGVALRTEDGQICSMAAPARHHDVIRGMAAAGYKNIQSAEQGFMLDSKVFVSRKRAKVVAIDAGQLLPRAHSGDELFSECVW